MFVLSVFLIRLSVFPIFIRALFQVFHVVPYVFDYQNLSERVAVLSGHFSSV